MLLLTHHACLAHENFPEHPECPDRLRAVLSALEAEEFAHLLRDVAPAATEAQLLLAHTPAHVADILSVRPAPGRFVPLDGDTGMNHATAEAALRAAGAATGLTGDELDESVARTLAFLRRRLSGDYTIDEFGYDEDFTEHVALPLLRPFINIAVVLNIIYVFNSFPIIWVMTQGDPANETDILVTWLYKLAFRYGRLDLAAALSIVMFAILLVFTIVYAWLAMRGERRAEAG